MVDGNAALARRPPRWVVVAALLVAICALGGLLVLDEPRSPASPSPVGWILFLLFAVPGYVVLNVVAESALEGLAGVHKWLGPILAVLVIAVFYAVWFWRMIQ